MYYCFNRFSSRLVLLAVIPAVAAFAGHSNVSSVKADRSSGRLVRRTASKITPAHPAPPSVPVSLIAAVEQAAIKHDVDPLLIHSVIRVESNYNPRAVSPAGAKGLMQLIPATAKRFGVRNSFNPRQNIDGGVQFLKHLLERFGNVPLALAAYNAGEAAVKRHGGIPPYKETRNYVQRVGQHLKAARLAAKKAHEAYRAENVRGSGYNPIERVLDANGRMAFITRQ